MMRLLVLLTLSLIGLPSWARLHLEWLQLPKGYQADIYAEVPNARSLTLGSNQIVFVGSMREGKVYALIPDPEHPHHAVTKTLAQGLHMPNGVAFYKGNLYVATVEQILKYNDIENQLDHPTSPTVLKVQLPKNLQHGWRYLRVGPDGKLYVSIGAPCNICLKDDQRFASIARMDLEGDHFEVFARGVRNAMGFTWDAEKRLWFTDNGRDWLGDNSPPDELNVAEQPYLHFGFPYCHGKAVSDPTYGTLYPCSAFKAPILELPAHVAALGMTFDHETLLIAEHGSWNRSKKVGYQILAVNVQGTKVLSTTPFISGWLHEDEVWGRPVDVLMMPDGALLISDDYAGVVYRVSKRAN